MVYNMELIMRMPCNASADTTTAPALVDVYTLSAGTSPLQAEHAWGVLKGARVALPWLFTVAAHAQSCAGLLFSKHMVLQGLL